MIVKKKQKPKLKINIIYSDILNTLNDKVLDKANFHYNVLNKDLLIKTIKFLSAKLVDPKSTISKHEQIQLLQSYNILKNQIKMYNFSLNK
jgi:hypothetical protein